jgi:hypothetical protein
MTEDDYGYTLDDIAGSALQRYKKNLRKKKIVNDDLELDTVLVPETDNGE